MIEVSKSETVQLRKAFKDAVIVRTVRHKSKRKKYFVEERQKILNALREMRETQ